jgi:hypothetical protein
MVSVSKSVRDVVTALMSDSVIGFNATLSTIAAAYDIKPFVIDFGPHSSNYFQGYYGAKDILETSASNMPLICAYTFKSQNTNQQIYATFSGTVGIGIDTYVSFPRSSAMLDTETLGDTVEDTYYNLFNSTATQKYWTSIGYNGDLVITRGAVAMGADNWYQLIKSQLTFDITRQS